MMTVPHRSTADAGFGYAIDPAAARRQFSISVAVVGGLAVAIAAAVLSLPRLPVAAPSYYTVSIPATTLHAERDRATATRS